MTMMRSLHSSSHFEKMQKTYKFKVKWLYYLINFSILGVEYLPLINF